MRQVRSDHTALLKTATFHGIDTISKYAFLEKGSFINTNVVIQCNVKVKSGCILNTSFNNAGEPIVETPIDAILGILNMDIDVLIPSASYSDNAEAAVLIISPYTSITKKIGGRMHLGINVGAGIDALSLSGTTYTLPYTFSVIAPGVKFGADLGYMLTPELNLNFGAGYKLGFAPLAISYTLDGEDYSEYLDNLIDYLDYSELNMGGVSFNAGVTYTLSELPVNIFGFLRVFTHFGNVLETIYIYLETFYL